MSEEAMTKTKAALANTVLTNTVLTIPAPHSAEVVERPYPTIVPGFVIIDVAVAPVCNEGRIFRDHQFEWHDSPEHLGHEGVGTIVETAEGSKFAVGDRVIVFQGNSCGQCFVCTQGLSPTHCLGIPYEGFDEGMAPQDVTAGLLGIEKVNGSASGGFGMVRYRIAPEHMIMELPDDLSFEHAAIGNCSFGVGYTACEEAGVKAGDVVIVGGVGFIGFGMIANALYRNATVIVLGRHEYRMDMCRQMGVHAIIDPDSDDWLEQVHAFTGDRRGADAAFECSGAPFYLDKCFEGLRRYGTLFSAGHAGSQKYSLSILNDLIDRHIVWTGGHDVRFRDRSGLVRMLADPEVQRHTEIVNTHTFPMTNAAEAFEVALSKNCGKIYLLPDQ